MLLLGAGQADITPPIGTPFGGLALERTSPATAVHDPLLACAVVLTVNEASSAVVSCDLQTISPELVGRVRERIQSDFGIPKESVLIAATHVHSAPGGDASERQIPGVDRYYTTPEAERRIEEGILTAIRRAWRTREEAELHAARGRIPGIGRSRHTPDSPTEASAALLVGSQPTTGRPLAVLANYGCHPSILGPDNTAVSADYPGVLRNRLSECFDRAPVTFLNAPAGDISTRATRREQTFTEVARLGNELADQILRLREALTPVSSNALSGASVVVPLPVDPSLRAWIGDQLARLPDSCSVRARRLRIQAERLEALWDTAIPCEVQVLRCGDIAFIGVAGELFSDLGEAITLGSPAPISLIAAPANGTIGNVPPARLHDVVRPLVSANAGALLVKEVEALLARVFGE